MIIQTKTGCWCEKSISLNIDIFKNPTQESGIFKLQKLSFGFPLWKTDFAARNRFTFADCASCLISLNAFCCSIIFRKSFSLNKNIFKNPTQRGGVRERVAEGKTQGECRRFAF